MEYLTLHDLRRIFTTLAGVDESVNLDGDILDTEFADLGYDSIAVLEAVGQIQRECGIEFDEDALSEVHTFRGLLELAAAVHT